jgi:hypothetical protein
MRSLGSSLRLGWPRSAEIGRERDRTVKMWVGVRAWAGERAGSWPGSFAFYVLVAFSLPFSVFYSLLSVVSLVWVSK